MHSTVLTTSLTVAALMAAFAHAETCDFAAIQGSLYPNATEGLQRCADATGFDVFSLTSLPTEEQAQTISENTDCANFYNQINGVANQAIQCDVVINGTTYDLQTLLADFLSGETGEEGSSSSSDDDSGSKSKGKSDSSTDEDIGSVSEDESGSNSEDIKIPSGSDSDSGSEGDASVGTDSGSSGAGAASLSAAITVAAIVAAFAA